MNARLKVWLRKRILVAIKKLRKLEKKMLGIVDAEPSYSSLSPIGDSKESQKYLDALDWALENRSIKDIKNIALTGPYGSGKSTILKTYWNNYTGTKFKFLFISLATFKEDSAKKEDPNAASSKDESGNDTDKYKTLRLIETSILEQIFYHEHDSKVPDSRFKKIRSFSSWQLVGYAVAYSIFIFCLYSYFTPGFIQKVLKFWKPDTDALNVIHYFSIVVIGIGIFMVIFSSIRMIRSVTLQKLNFQNAEIGIGVNQNKSILNHHIDELLYFFTVRPYNVVVIEDLDRFKETEIFTKLREINLLLNNSKKTKRKDIVFIYAVRDEMFDDKERTKFFDFIIPVIPIINSSNSGNKLMTKRKDHNYGLSDNLIEDVSYYIDDMRLLHNITNEFYLYREMLDQTLSQDKLFAILTYKNKYPKDFVELSRNKGEAYRLIHSKWVEIEIRTAELNKQIFELKPEISRLRDLSINSHEELRLLYIARLLPQMKNFKNFLIEGSVIQVQDMTEEENFVHLENDKLKYEFYYTSSSNYQESVATTAVAVRFEDLEEQVDSKFTYRQRIKEIDDLNSNRIQIIRSKIQELEQEKERLRNLPVAEIMQKNAVESEPGKEIALLQILVRNGYVAEDYLDYISLFHEGDISKTDYQFLLNLKNGNALDMDYKLQKADRVIGKINPVIFQSNLVLNYDLLDQMLKDIHKYSDRLKWFLETLKDESEGSIKFITTYLERTPHLGIFIRHLTNVWPNIWHFFEGVLENDKKNQLFTWLISYLENNEILVLSKHYDLSQKIAADPAFTQIISNQKKIRDLLTILKIKFLDIDFENSDAETLEHIYKNNLYELNPLMLTKMMNRFCTYDQHEFEHRNYAAIKNSESAELMTYIDKNINGYVESVYLKLDKNVQDDEATILSLLNNADLKREYKYKIIARMDKKISNLSKVNDNEVISKLFIQNKVVPTWDNVLLDFMNHEKEISEDLVSFLNVQENTELLCKTKLPSQGDQRTNYIALAKKMSVIVGFDDLVFEQLAEANSFWFDDLDLSQVPYEQVERLIMGRVIRPNKKSFEYLKDEFSPLHIRSFGRDQTEIMKILDTLTLDSEDVELILKSEFITLVNKMKVLDHVEEDLVITNQESLKAVSSLLINQIGFSVSETLLNAVLISNAVLSEERIRLVFRREVDKAYLEQFIPTLSGDYLKIMDRSKRPTFTKNESNRRFLELLRKHKIISSFTEQRGKYKVYHSTK